VSALPTEDAAWIEARRSAMAILARAPVATLEEAFAAFDPGATIVDVRPPDVGLVMVRGRMGGGGRPFNLGEVTVTRSTVRLPSGTVGFAHVLGRNRRHARLAAILDALWQDNPAEVEARVLAPVRAALEAADRQTAEETAATRVDFFTMVRGEPE
jgi:alpha-D-ribose 1-methylphosphonate 5-triphosphate synthase subunit PhnG